MTSAVQKRIQLHTEMIFLHLFRIKCGMPWVSALQSEQLYTELCNCHGGFWCGNIVNSVIRFYRLTHYLQVLPTTHWNSSSAMIAIIIVHVKKYSFNLLQLPCNATTTIHASWAVNILYKSQPGELLCHCDTLVKSEKQNLMWIRICSVLHVKSPY